MHEWRDSHAFYQTATPLFVLCSVRTSFISHSGASRRGTTGVLPSPRSALRPFDFIDLYPRATQLHQAMHITRILTRAKCAGWNNVSLMLVYCLPRFPNINRPTQQTRGIHPMLLQCWASVEDGGPTLKQHWVNAPCLLGRQVSPSWLRGPVLVWDCLAVADGGPALGRRIVW